MESAPIRKAATLVLWRNHDTGPEIFLIQRHRKSGFMGNAHVFPGGRLDDADRVAAKETAPSQKNRCAERSPMTDDPELATALCWAAVRETAEESGIFLCGSANQAWPTPSEQQQAQKALQEGTPFYQILQERQWQPFFEALHPIAWWLTPPVEPKRYDTLFFAAQIEGPIVTKTDDRETHGGRWWPVREFFNAYQAQDLFLAPPTFAVMEDVAQALNFDDFVAQSRPERLICPDLQLNESGQMDFRLPGHPDHPENDKKQAVGTRIALSMNAGGHLQSIRQD
ncbi:MAG: hypothetical protein CMH56_15570 [Myxococcales bacterium]|nr:hypothetical protein [Myxococcales bacterium]